MEGVCPPRNPMVGNFPTCCARAAIGHATAAPPSRVMNSRRFMGSPPQAGSRTLPHRCARTLLCSAARLLIEWQRRVQFGHGGMSALSPLYPQLRTLVAAAGTAASCQNRS